MYLHKDKEIFRDIVEQTAEQSGRTPVVIEKDYYVTLILKLLSDVSAIITEFCDNSFYEEDYQSITGYFTEDFVSYEDTIKNMRKIIQDISF